MDGKPSSRKLKSEGGNLRGPFTPEEARYYGAMGAAASAKVRRRKKALREQARDLLMTNLDAKQVRSLQKAFGAEVDIEGASVYTLLVAAMFRECMGGNVAAFKALTDAAEGAGGNDVDLTGTLRKMGYIE